MKWLKLREQKDKEALEMLIKEMEGLGWEKSPDTKEKFVPYYICFQKDNQRIVIEWLEYVSFETEIVHGYVMISIAKFLEAVKL